MINHYVFYIYKFGTMNDGKKIINIASTFEAAIKNVAALYPGYSIIEA